LLCFSPDASSHMVLVMRCWLQTIVDVTSTALPNASPMLLHAVVPAHALDPSSQYVFTVEVSLRWAGGAVTAGSMANIVTAVCPTGGEVTIFPSHGIAGLTR
jgi:hypothetical protein